MRSTETAETLTATTARPVLFATRDSAGHVTGGTRRPAGATVYARQRRDGLFAVRIPGTLLTQVVRLADLIPA